MPFQYLDVAEDEANKAEMLGLNGGKSAVPTILVDGRVVMVGGTFRPAILQPYVGARA